MSLEIIITILTSLGLGSIIGGYINHLLEKKKEIELKQKQINEDKYKNILIFMLVILDINTIKHAYIQDEINIHSLDEDNLKIHFIQKLKTHYYFSIINTLSKETLVSIKKFIEEQNIDNYLEVAISMKNDLWGKNKNLIIKDLKLK